MIDTANAGVVAPCTPTDVGSERLLGITDVCEMMNVCPVTASRIIKESGHEINLHRRVYILESSFFAYMRKLEEAVPCLR